MFVGAFVPMLLWPACIAGTLLLALSKILENMTEVALGPAAAFSVFVIVVVLAVSVLLNGALRYLTAPSLRVSKIGI